MVLCLSHTGSVLWYYMNLGISDGVWRKSTGLKWTSFLLLSGRKHFSLNNLAIFTDKHIFSQDCLQTLDMGWDLCLLFNTYLWLVLRSASWLFSKLKQDFDIDYTHTHTLTSLQGKGVQKMDVHTHAFMPVCVFSMCVEWGWLFLE